MATHNDVEDEKKILNCCCYYLRLRWSWRHSGRVFSGGNRTICISWVVFLVLKFVGVVAVLIVKRAFSPAELAWWATEKQQSTSIHFYSLWVITKTIFEVFSSCVLEKGDDHCHLHFGFVIGISFLRLFYSIESNAVICRWSCLCMSVSTVLTRSYSSRVPCKRHFLLFIHTSKRHFRCINVI
jgi:hypothetical protein